jgi:hypothetical protein
MSAICSVLGIARRTAYYIARVRPGGRYHRADDGTVLQQIRSRATYGYRRVWAMVNRTFRARYNRKRIRRVMQLHGLMLAPRVHRRHGRPHLGQIQQPASNQRWCSALAKSRPITTSSRSRRHRASDMWAPPSCLGRREKG